MNLHLKIIRQLIVALVIFGPFGLAATGSSNRLGEGSISAPLLQNNAVEHEDDFNPRAGTYHQPISPQSVAVTEDVPMSSHAATTVELNWFKHGPYMSRETHPFKVMNPSYNRDVVVPYDQKLLRDLIRKKMSYPKAELEQIAAPMSPEALEEYIRSNPEKRVIFQLGGFDVLFNHHMSYAMAIPSDKPKETTFAFFEANPLERSRSRIIVNGYHKATNVHGLMAAMASKPHSRKPMDIGTLMSARDLFNIRIPRNIPRFIQF